ncbi:MAG: S8 family serine peptidase [Ectothiorhodospiraceae bacterium]|nr:S8 family serine peptidase [Ectothiorhodospiraceae bacterium]
MKISNWLRGAKPRWLLPALVAVFAAMVLTGCFGGSSSGGGGGGGNGDGDADPAGVTLRATGVNPGSADEGALVEVGYTVETEDDVSVDASDIRVVLGGEELGPESASSDKVSFRIPAGVSGDTTLYLKAGAAESNTLQFTVTSGVSVVTPAPEDIVTGEDGSELAVNLVMIFVETGHDPDSVAQAAATAEGGEVVGWIDALRARQLRLPTESIEQLEAAVERLKAMDGIKNVVMDIQYEPDDLSVDWSADPDLTGQRASNRVEEGVDAYINAVHPTRSDAVSPYFRSIGVFEAGVHYSLDDYAGYATDGGSRSGGIALFAPDRGTSTSRGSNHGSNVVGILAAELGDGGAAGLLRAAGEVGAHGGFNIRVGNSGGSSAHGFMGEIILALEAGARVFNMSAGVHKCEMFSASVCVQGTLQSDGNVVTNNARQESVFDSWKVTFDEVVGLVQRDYPDAILVVSAGNGNTDAGDRDWRLFGAHPSDQVLTVGAHDNASSPGREGYSNYGERVDISAAGTVRASRGGGSTSGTSFAAPLVAATVAAMRSIEPDLTPVQVRQILRSTALPIDDNGVTLHDEDGNEIGSTVFTRALTEAEAGAGDERVGKGARLNVEGAILEALARRDARTRRTGDPLSVSISGRETVTRSVNVTIPGEGVVFDRVDIMFLVDVSGSYGSSIAQFQAQAVDLVNAFEAGGTDVYTGLATFSDFPIPLTGSGPDDYAFRLDQALTGDGAQTIEAINGMELLFGGDLPESQLEALYQLATGAGRTVEGYPEANIEPSNTGWRDGSLRIVFLATDANFHTPEDEEYGHYTEGFPGPSWRTTVDALRARGIRVYGLERGYEVRDVRDIVEQTNGEVFQLDSASSQIVEAVEEALASAAAELDLELVPNGDFAGLIQDITPELIEGVSRGDTVTFEVSLSRGTVGPGEHVFVFRLEVVGAGTAIIEEIPVIVNLD